MKKSLVLIFAAFLVVSACGGNKETVQIVQQAPQKPSGGGDSSGGSGLGGADVGGGVTVDGKQVDEYRVRISELKEYQDNIIPIINILAKKFPELAADFLHITQNRSWIIIPADLPSLDPLKIGILYKADSAQAAYHLPERILIDERIWNKMTEKSRAMLLLHEIVLGVHWIDSHEAQDRCLAESKQIFVKNDFKETDDFKLSRENCYKNYPYFVNVTKFKIKAEDYNNIETISSDLGKYIEKIDWEELKLWISSRKFRVYN
jgi:hypothetical protein